MVRGDAECRLAVGSCRSLAEPLVMMDGLSAAVVAVVLGEPLDDNKRGETAENAFACWL